MKRRGQGREFSIEKVIIKHMAVPDADQRLARALDLLLQVAESRVSPLEREAAEKSQESSQDEHKRG